MTRAALAAALLPLLSACASQPPLRQLLPADAAPSVELSATPFFAQDEWRLRPNVSLIAGLRGDFWNVTSEATPGYDVSAVIAGAQPPIHPSTLPNPNGDTYRRQSLTGDIGLIANQNGALSPFIRFGRSYRHPNLEEMFFAGPATVGSIVPNVTVKPETGNNFDSGAKFVLGRVTGGAYVFVNQYHDFIAQDLVVATSPGGPLAQTTNYADVRITGVELNVDAPIVLGRGVLTLASSGAFTRGTVTDGVNPLDGDGHRLASVLEQGGPRPQQEAVEVVAGRDTRFNFQGRAAVLQHPDEHDEEVRHPLAELLDVGVLVRRALVAVDRQPLLDAVALEVELLAERLHHQLLQVAAEKQQPVLVRQHDHVL